MPDAGNTVADQPGPRKNGRDSLVLAAFQLYPADFLASSKVRKMSTLEVGAYFLLLLAEWQDMSLPSDLSELAEIARMKPSAFGRAWKHLGPCFFAGTDGRLYNARLEREREVSMIYKSGQSKRGALGNEIRWKKHRDAIAGGSGCDPKPIASDRSSPTSSSSPSPTSTNSVPTVRGASAPPKTSEKAVEHPDHRPLIAFFVAQYQTAYGRKYPFARGKDGAHAAKLLSLGTRQEAEDAISAAFKDAWWSDKGIDLACIVGQYAKFRALATNPSAATETTAVRRMKEQIAESNSAPAFNPMEALTAAGRKRLTQ